MSTVLIGREQSRDLRRHSSSFAYHVTSLWRLPSCFGAMLFCDDTVTRGRCYGSNVSTVLMSREPSRDLRRHSSSFVHHVTSLWRLPSCFAAMLFCIDTINSRKNCRNDYKLGLGLATLMKGQRSPTFCTYSIASWG